MKKFLRKIQPKTGFAGALHLAFTILLPILLYVFVRIDLPQLAIATIILSKWRMFAVRPRYWLANIQANSVDIIVGLSAAIFMLQAGSQIWQLIWAIAYAMWLLLIKPGTSQLAISTQAFLAQTTGLMAIYLELGDSDTFVLVVMSWLICFAAARHFFSAFDEPLTRFLSSVWAFFAASLAWLLSHWLLFYGLVAQPVLILSVLGLGLGSMYYLDDSNKLSVLVRRQMIFIMIAVMVVIIVFSSWGDKTV